MEKKRAFQMRKEKEESMTEQSIPPNMYLGHVHLKVANLERALTFYLEVIGFELVFEAGGKSRQELAKKEGGRL